MRINLLPPEFLERQRARRRTIAVVAVGIIVLAALGAFYLLQAMRLADVRDQVAQQESENARLTAQIAELQNIHQLEVEVLEKRRLLAALQADRVRWSGILRDISLVIPGEAWLSGLTGATAGATAVDPGVAGTQPGGAAPPTAVGGALIGEITFNGFAFEHRDVALWLSRLEDIRGFVNPWLSTSSKTTIGLQEVVQFTNSVDLSEQVLARRGGTP